MQKIMHLNLDTFEIEIVALGRKSELADGNHEQRFCSIHVQNSLVQNINVRLSEFYSEGEVFEGNLLINGSYISLDKNLQPQVIAPFFTNQTDHWDDGVEVNYQYKIGQILLEFSWHRNGDRLVANYISMEQE